MANEFHSWLWSEPLRVSRTQKICMRTTIGERLVQRTIAKICHHRVTTLGQPLEVVKTTMAANRGDNFASALGRVWGRGGVFGCKDTRPKETSQG